jgi:hypothetical protein
MDEVCWVEMDGKGFGKHNRSQDLPLALCQSCGIVLHSTLLLPVSIPPYIRRSPSAHPFLSHVTHFSLPPSTSSLRTQAPAPCGASRAPLLPRAFPGLRGGAQARGIGMHDPSSLPARPRDVDPSCLFSRRGGLAGEPKNSEIEEESPRSRRGRRSEAARVAGSRMPGSQTDRRMQRLGTPLQARGRRGARDAAPPPPQSESPSPRRVARPNQGGTIWSPPGVSRAAVGKKRGRWQKLLARRAIRRLGNERTRRACCAKCASEQDNPPPSALRRYRGEGCR